MNKLENIIIIILALVTNLLVTVTVHSEILILNIVVEVLIRLVWTVIFYEAFTYIYENIKKYFNKRR